MPLCFNPSVIEEKFSSKTETEPIRISNQNESLGYVDSFLSQFILRTQAHHQRFGSVRETSVYGRA